MLDRIKEIHKHLRIANKYYKDECSDYNILGTKARVFVDQSYWYIYIFGYSWSLAKRYLSFMEVFQDGDHEGILKLNRMPSFKEAMIIRRIAGFRKKRVLSASDRKKAIERIQNFMFKPGYK